MSAVDVCEKLCALGQPGAVAPRLLAVLAHPDDEVIALGGRLEWLRGSHFVTVTDGMPSDGADARDHGFRSLAEYGEARHSELVAALAHAGLEPSCATTLALPDGSRVADQRAALSLAAIARAVTTLLDRFEPDAVITHPYEGGHPDHDACAFAVRAAVRRSGRGTPVIEAPFYHVGADGHGMATGAFLPGNAGHRAVLTPQQAHNKRARLLCFASQAQTLQAFGTVEERYRVAPVYDFLQRPHAGRLHYELYDWGMTGDRFCTLAADALRELAR